MHTNFIKREEPEKLLFNRISLEYIYLQMKTRQPNFNAMVEDGMSSKDLLTNVQAKWRRDTHITSYHTTIHLHSPRVSLFSTHSSSDEKSAIAMPDNLLPLSRDLKCLDCLGASGVWRSSKPLDSSGSRGIRKVCTFEGVLYAKCDFFAIKVCWLQTEIGFKYGSKQEQIKPNEFFKIWGTYCVSDCVWYMEKLLQIIMIHTTQYPNLQKGNPMINKKSFNQI